MLTRSRLWSCSASRLQSRAFSLLSSEGEVLRLAGEVQPAATSEDFAHHAQGVARLNHGSFGALPRPVQRVQDQLRLSYLSRPDEWYFTQKLHRELRLAAESAATVLHSDLTLDCSDADLAMPGANVCLLENATVATVTIARRWARMAERGDVIVMFDTTYKACQFALREECERAGAHFLVLNTPFPAQSSDAIVESIHKQLVEAGKKIRFALVDHVSSQPALLLPTARIIASLRSFASSKGMEVAVDGSHSVGSVPDLHVSSLGADFFFSNLHKWSFAPPTATIFWAARSDLLKTTHHPITSWDCGAGLDVEACFPGSRDFSAMLAVPAAVRYLQRWRSEEEELDPPSYCRMRVLQASNLLARAWGVPDLANDAPELVTAQAMVPLPPALRVDDAPGQPGRGVRSRLREEYGVEAAIGNFGSKGAFVRLSFAVYNTTEDVLRLRDGVLDLLRRQDKS